MKNWKIFIFKICTFFIQKFVSNLFFYDLGNNSVYQFQQCEEEFCSEKIVEIDAPMSQIILLLEMHIYLLENNK